MTESGSVFGIRYLLIWTICRVNLKVCHEVSRQFELLLRFFSTSGLNIHIKIRLTFVCSYPWFNIRQQIICFSQVVLNFPPIISRLSPTFFLNPRAAPVHNSNLLRLKGLQKFRTQQVIESNICWLSLGNLVYRVCEVNQLKRKKNPSPKLHYKIPSCFRMVVTKRRSIQASTSFSPPPRQSTDN